MTKRQKANLKKLLFQDSNASDLIKNELKLAKKTIVNNAGDLNNQVIGDRNMTTSH